MVLPSIEVADGERLLLSGDLVFPTVGALLSEGERLLASASQPEIDLSGVGRCDSAALALLLEWLEIGQAAGKRPVFSHVPEALLGIARLSNAERLLTSQIP